MNIWKFCVVLGILVSGSISLTAGSYFASKSNGLGIRQYTISTRGMGMGGVGMAANDSIALNNNVISQWRYINDTRTTIGLSYFRYRSEVQSLNFTTSTADFAGVNIAVPLQRKKWVFGVTLKPYTVIDFKGTQKVETDGVAFTQISQFVGSISKAQVSLVWAPAKALGLAVSGNFYFGSIDDRFDFQFNDINFRNTTHVVEYQISGVGVGVSSDFQPAKSLRLAGFVDFKPTMKITKNYTSPITSPAPKERTFDSFPLHYGVGGQLLLTRQLVIGADYSYQNWSKVLRTAQNDFEDWYHIGVGLEHHASKTRKAGFFNRLDLRIGASSTRLGYKFNNESVTENAVHVGLGIPFANHHNRIDLAFVGGIRGDINKNLAEEKFLKAQFSISLGERWFQNFR